MVLLACQDILTKVINNTLVCLDRDMVAQGCRLTWTDTGCHTQATLALACHLSDHPMTWEHTRV